MSEMIERVAREAYFAFAEGRRAAPLTDETREIFRRVARAAIAAMRSPTEAMWTGWRSVNCMHGTDGMEEFTHFCGDYGNWLACHHAMIDEALR